MTGLAERPRLPLGRWPTPMYPAERLSETLGIDLWFKRDDLAGLGLGGNKARPLEYLLGDALAGGFDCLLTGAGPQSNWAFLATLAARSAGLDPILCFYGDPPDVVSGNLLLLERWVAPEIHWTGDADRQSVDALLEQTAAQLRERGRRPYVLPRGGATALGTAGYLAAALEMAEQSPLAAHSTVWLATGSCGTQAGLVLGIAAGHLGRVVGVTVSRPATEACDRVLRLSNDGADLWGSPAPGQGDVEVVGGWIGDGYGVASAAGTAATALVARTEGVLLDPVFGAKAMAALVAAARAGSIRGPVIFLVTGGAPSLFAAGGGT